MSVKPFLSRHPRAIKALALTLPLALVGAAKLPWTELTEADWLYSLATRFATVEGHQVHYPTPPAELAKLLEARKEGAALRQLADTRLELGDRAGAQSAMEQWARQEGTAGAWDEAARWAASHQEWPLAFRAAASSLEKSSADGTARHRLADARIAWAEAHPEQGDALALRQARSALFPQDAAALEDWIRALERADRLPEADKALASSQALSPERRLLLRSDLAADHGRHADALRVLEEALVQGAASGQSWSMDLRRAFATRVDKGAPASPASWRASLERAFDPGALVRLGTYFQGQRRGDAAMDLLQQMERRFGDQLGRADHLLIARLYQEIDAAPEAFRATLAAAHGASDAEQRSDLASLARLALAAGGRPLAQGTYNDEVYHWAARVDRTPGFWTGGVSFLLTGLPWKESLERLETDSLPERTFATARALEAELARRDGRHRDLPGLRVAIMERHVERGEGKAALDLLPQVEGAGASAATLDEARRVALLAMRLVDGPIAQEVKLMQSRLRFLAPDGSRPAVEGARDSDGEGEDYAEAEDGGYRGEASRDGRSWARVPREGRTQTYDQVLRESISRLEGRDRSHLASLGLILAELDRLPEAEDLWLSLAGRLEGWDLDEALGPRYEGALERFKGPGVWRRLARWHAKRSHHADLRRLAQSVSQRFRSSEIFSRLEGTEDIRIEIPEQPQVRGRVRLAPWADWVRFKALERFPHSPAVFSAARHLLTESQWTTALNEGGYKNTNRGPVVIPDALMESRSWALFFVDPAIREAYLNGAMRKGTLEDTLKELERRGQRTPVEEQLLFEGWARLSRFEQAYAPADRLAAAYPGDGALAARVLSLHRSLNGLTPSVHAGLAKALVERTAPALEEPGGLWTELGELEEDRGRPEAALEVWKQLLAKDPRNPSRITETATLLWDYNHDAEALAVVEAGRQRLARPHFFAFETGVLRENLRDLDGAVREYLAALQGESGSYSSYDQDQRSLRRLAQLMARIRVFKAVEKRIQSLQPGSAQDERMLTAFFPLATLEIPTPEQMGQDDDWIDRVDMPSDPTGRAQRAEGREKARPGQYDAIARVGDLLLAKVEEMTPRAAAPEFLDAAEPWSEGLTKTRWKEDRILALKNASLARRAELCPSEEGRIQQEMARADFLARHRMGRQADAVWAALAPRISALPDGSTKLQAEAARAGFLERTKGAPEAAAEWNRLSAKYPWSLGLLEDRLAFLQRSGKDLEARTLLEGVIPKAAQGHREALLERLTQDSLAANDLPRARKAVQQLLAEKSLEDGRRLGALHLLARLSLRENPAWDAQAAAKEASAALPGDLHADLYAQMARAADLESCRGMALGLWIEALNRRTDRAWLQAACRSAQKGGKAAELLDFFEKQKARSPRDVRWAAAVRDIKRDLHDVAGAIQAAQSAVAVRPEREDLWREASELMVRGDRIREAADYLEGWNKPRPADENVARWRSELYARAGDADRALAVEQAALAAFQKESTRDTGKDTGRDSGELARRKARAAERLLGLGLPGRAVRLYSPTGEITALANSELSEGTQASLALLTGQFPRLLARLEASDSFRARAASVLARQGRPEQREEAMAFLQARLWPKAGPSSEALNRWWSFAEQAGLEAHLRMALAQQYLAAVQGPWQGQPSLPFVHAVGAGLIQIRSRGNQARYEFRSPELPPLWMKDLARRDRPEELAAFIEPRWQELMEELRKQPVLNASTSSTLGTLAAMTLLGPQGAKAAPPKPPSRLSWSTWMDDSEVLEAWARGAAKRPEKAQELALAMSNRANWDRFWALAARGWSSEPLVALLPETTRLAWFRLWETAPRAQDPVLVARAKTVEGATLALARLIKGEAQSADAPEIVKLRGPRTVGEVLGHDAAWIWPEFKLRRNAAGEIAETGEDRVVGSGSDAGRLPGALWGERPGEAWYVLETLARYRKGDETAPLVPGDVPVRGGETDRTLLAIRIAKAQKNLALAMEFENARPGALGDARRLETRVSLLMANQRKDEALDSLRGHLKHIQPRLNEKDFRWADGLAREHALPPAMDLMDPQTPVGPAFLAYLVDRRKDAADRFHTSDPTGFRVALASRWAGRERQLSAEQIRYWLHELWVQDAARLPIRGLARRGGIWSFAGPWLAQVPLQERAEALRALEEFGSTPGLLFDRLALTPGDTAALLAVRARLMRGETAPALALVDAMLAGLRAGNPLSLSAYAIEAESTASVSDRGEEEAAIEGDEEVSSRESARQTAPDRDPLVERLGAWLLPFQEAKQAPPVEERFRALLKERREEGRTSSHAWRLAFRLAPEAERPALAQELDAAWFRGDVPTWQIKPLCQVLAEVLPAEAPRWIARWPQDWEWTATRDRAAVYANLKQPEAVARTLADARRRAPWTGSEEIQAFDFWRRHGAAATPELPATWRDALPFWTAKAEGIGASNAGSGAGSGTGTGAGPNLEARLRAHPFDGLSARAALRTLAPGDEQAMLRAARTSASWSDEDQMILDLRVARALLPQSWRAASRAIRGHDPEDFLRQLVAHRMKTAEINAALADLARLAQARGEDGRARKLLAQMEERKAPGLQALRTELTAGAAPGPQTYRMVDGRPTAIRPRDLTWALLAQVLKTEGVQ